MISNCCGANVKWTDICCDCGEHCEVIEEEEDHNVNFRLVKTGTNEMGIPKLELIKGGKEDEHR